MKSETQPKSKAGAFYLMFIGFLLFLMGGLFAVLMAGSFFNAVNTREWTPAKAYIVYSDIEKRRVEGSPPEFRWEVMYTYTISGKTYSSDKFKPRGARWKKDIRGVEKLKEKYPVGAEVDCFVNPENLDQALLGHDSKAAGYSIWFPLLFAVGGIGVMVSAIRSMLREKQTVRKSSLRIMCS